MSILELPISEQDLGYLSQIAQKEKCSREEAAAALVHRVLKAQRDWEYLEERARQGALNPKSLRDILDKAGDAPPMPGDELPEGWNKP